MLLFIFLTTLSLILAGAAAAGSTLPPAFLPLAPPSPRFSRSPSPHEARRRYRHSEHPSATPGPLRRFLVSSALNRSTRDAPAPTPSGSAPDPRICRCPISPEFPPASPHPCTAPHHHARLAPLLQQIPRPAAKSESPCCTFNPPVRDSPVAELSFTSPPSDARSNPTSQLLLRPLPEPEQRRLCSDAATPDAVAAPVRLSSTAQRSQ